ncbi:MAG: hypothetical protein AMK73_03460 [Planctomycetes bacterium SM23_32]|nr:MAG: hypothetical protein AMK73_03460 [Planctomycetes bacterium SM23_32]
MVLSGLLLLTGCGSYMDFRRPAFRNYVADFIPPTSRPELPEPTGPTRAERLAEALAKWMEESPPAAEEYGVGPGDLLGVSVFLPTLSGEGSTLQVPVDEQGQVSMPLIGNVPVAGLTTAQVEQELARRYADGYYRDPVVSVVVSRHESKWILVSGAVASPGVISLQRNRVTFLEAILLAGGLTKEAGETGRLTRSGPPEPPQEAESRTIEVDLEQLIEDPAVQQNLWVYPGDAVHVAPVVKPPERFFYVLGYVRAPGAFEWPQDRVIHAMDAVGYAHGLAPSARSDKTYLLRSTPDGDEVHRIDLTKIAAAEEPDVPVLAEDIIIVSTSWGRRTIDGILYAIGLRGLVPPGGM